MPWRHVGAGVLSKAYCAAHGTALAMAQSKRRSKPTPKTPCCRRAQVCAALAPNCVDRAAAGTPRLGCACWM